MAPRSGREAVGVTADGNEVELTLTRALAEGEAVTVGHTAPNLDGGLWDAAGNQAANLRTRSGSGGCGRRARGASTSTRSSRSGSTGDSPPEH